MQLSEQTLKTIRLGSWGLVLVAVLVVAWFRFLAPQVEGSIADRIGRGDYVLETTTGEPFTQASLQGQPTGVFFGFTHCPLVCPTTLGDIATWQYELFGDDPDPDMQFYFVTVDPERDTVDILGDYVSWAPGVTGVTGTPEEVQKALKAFAIYAQKVPQDDGGYDMNHFASVLLFDANGNLFEPIGYGEGVDRAVAKIKRLLAL